MNFGESKLTIKELIEKAFTEGNGRDAFGKSRKDRLAEAKKLEEWFKSKYGKERNQQSRNEGAENTKPHLYSNPLDLTLDNIIDNSDIFIEHIQKGIRILTKDKHIYAYKVEHLIKFLNEKYAAGIDTKFLDYIKCSSKEQRYLEELKYLHAKGKNRGEIADIFCISERQFDDDASAIKDGFKFMNTEIKNAELSISDRGEYTSPVHPVFLALNSAQIYALTIGMKLLSKDTVFEHAMSSVSDEIYAQLTDFARDMIDQQPEAKDMVFDESKRKFVDSREFVKEKSHLHYCQYIKSQEIYNVKYQSDSGDLLTVSGTINLAPDGRFWIGNPFLDKITPNKKLL